MASLQHSSVRRAREKGVDNSCDKIARDPMSKLSKEMTLRQFDHGYWYATEIKRFAQSLGVPAAHRLRKDELEKAIRHFLTHGKVTSPTRRDLSRSGIKDVDRGLRLDLTRHPLHERSRHQGVPRAGSPKAGSNVQASIRLAISAQSLARSSTDAWGAHHVSRPREGVRASQSSRDDVPASAGGPVRLLPQRFHGRESRGKDGGRHSRLEDSEENGLA